MPANQRAKSFLLGDLLPYEGQFVHNIIRDSIDAYVDQMNLNGIQDVCSNLRMVGIESAQFDHFYPKLAKCMARRHQIVHQMDRNHAVGTGNARVQSISVNQVRDWQENTKRFVQEVVEVADNGT
ncbi:hypothetical protein CSC70_01440 [Pseudoxanthomonas kalamensis DSM 18571]|nr:hypothetical protein CSC70_01440 [Pseudoxanthomonas kalamensis DSM 18571]